MARRTTSFLPPEDSFWAFPWSISARAILLTPRKWSLPMVGVLFREFLFFGGLFLQKKRLGHPFSASTLSSERRRAFIRCKRNLPPSLSRFRSSFFFFHGEYAVPPLLPSDSGHYRHSVPPVLGEIRTLPRSTALTGRGPPSFYFMRAA